MARLFVQGILLVAVAVLVADAVIVVVGRRKRCEFESVQVRLIYTMYSLDAYMHAHTHTCMLAAYCYLTCTHLHSRRCCS